MKIKHVGINSNRIRTNPRERVFAEEWAEIAPTTLHYLIGTQDSRDKDYSQRDAEVAATIIQWLGSNVGYSFLEEVLHKIGKEIR